MPDPTNSIRAKVMDSNHRSIMLRERLLKCNNAVTLRIYLAMHPLKALTSFISHQLIFK